ncbi:MAG: type II toxin-antitoxin system RelE/ParE family toxin [Candidatus Diapherotrites archaeon]
MRWLVLLSESAKKDFYELDNGLRERLKKGFEKLKENPFQPRSGADIKKLSGSYNPAFYRLRVGDYRAIFAIQEKEVKITRILPRKKAYKWMD